MALPPILFHYFRHPLAYAEALTLQETIHRFQLQQRQTEGRNKDILLLLQHRPVYTAGRRQKTSDIYDEGIHLERTGADFVRTSRGGEITYHGPGQIVGYPLLNLSNYSPIMGARDYVCRMQKVLELHLKEAHGIDTVSSEHTGVFLDPTTKVGSIGIQIRHRLTSHGFALNFTQEPCRWFKHIVACGLRGVNAGSVEDVVGRPIRIEDEIIGLANRFGLLYERECLPLNTREEGDIGAVIEEVEAEAARAGPWLREPRRVSYA